LAGVPTARALAMAERRCGRFLVRSYFLMEEISGGTSLEQLAKAGSLTPDVIREVARLIGRLHHEGFAHRDLKPSNILLDQAGHPHLIDLDGLTHVGEISEQRAAADLDRLARGVRREGGDAPNRRLFLRTYCRVRGLKRVPR
jgi:tRNA A-37 threonylcarbamoyl transferase component Bud32